MSFFIEDQKNLSFFFFFKSAESYTIFFKPKKITTQYTERISNAR